MSSSTTSTYFFSVCVKPMQNVVTKSKKTHSDIILEQLVRSVARNILVSKTFDIFLRFANISALPTFCIGDVERIKNL